MNVDIRTDAAQFFFSWNTLIGFSLQCISSLPIVYLGSGASPRGRGQARGWSHHHHRPDDNLDSIGCGRRRPPGPRTSGGRRYARGPAWGGSGAGGRDAGRRGRGRRGPRCGPRGRARSPRRRPAPGSRTRRSGHAWSGLAKKNEA